MYNGSTYLCDYSSDFIGAVGLFSDHDILLEVNIYRCAHLSSEVPSDYVIKAAISFQLCHKGAIFKSNLYIHVSLNELL